MLTYVDASPLFAILTCQGVTINCVLVVCGKIAMNRAANEVQTKSVQVLVDAKGFMDQTIPFPDGDTTMVTNGIVSAMPSALKQTIVYTQSDPSAVMD